MRPYLFPIIALALVSSVQLSVADDKAAPTEASEKVWADYHTLEHEVTDLYQKILIGLPTASEREKFTDAQNAWLKYRDLQGEFAAQGAPDEAHSKMLRAASFTETSQARLAELKAWVAAHPAK